MNDFSADSLFSTMRNSVISVNCDAVVKGRSLIEVFQAETAARFLTSADLCTKSHPGSADSGWSGPAYLEEDVHIKGRDCERKPKT
jgi:hypothetical protein